MACLGVVAPAPVAVVVVVVSSFVSPSSLCRLEKEGEEATLFKGGLALVVFGWRGGGGEGAATANDVAAAALLMLAFGVVASGTRTPTPPLASFKSILKSCVLFSFSYRLVNVTLL